MSGHPLSPPIDFTAVAPGFADPVYDAQACFRCILDATAHPGRVVRLPASPQLLNAALAPAAAAVALTLCDIDTPVWLDEPVRNAGPFLTFHCGSPLTDDPTEARFAFAANPATLPALDRFALGTDEYPERSTTLVVEVPGLENGGALQLTGPGIRDRIALHVAGLRDGFWQGRAELAQLFPRGIDLSFVAGERLAAVPRSTRAVFQGAF